MVSLLAEATPSALDGSGEPSRSVRRRLVASDARRTRFTIEVVDALGERLVRDGWVRAYGGAASSLADLDSGIFGGLMLCGRAASLCHGLHLEHLAIVGVGGRGRLASQARLVLLQLLLDRIRRLTLALEIVRVVVLVRQLVKGHYGDELGFCHRRDGSSRTTTSQRPMGPPEASRARFRSVPST